MTTTKHHLTLFRGSDDAGHFTWSPFVAKLEFRLRVSHVPYTRGIGSALAAPRRKIPYLDLTTTTPSPSNGREQQETTQHLSDSTFITKTLITQKILPDLNATLTPTQRGIDAALRAMLEEKLFFLQSYERWIVNFEVMRDKVYAALPLPQRMEVGEAARENIVRKLDLQGVGRYSEDEMRGLVCEIWGAVDALLEESRAKAKAPGDDEESCFWVLGEKDPSEADASVFGFAVSSQRCKAGPETAELVRTRFPVVLEYVRRIQKRYFGDYAAFDA